MILVSKYFLHILLFIAILLGLYRVFGFISNPVPLGYDPGLYKMLFDEYAQNLPNIRFDNLSPWVMETYPPLLGLLSNVLIIIGFSSEFILSYGMGFFSLFTIFPLYMMAKKYLGINSALIVVIIFCISITQYQAFWLNYFKQSLGIILMLPALYTIDTKKYIVSLPLILGIFSIHRPSGVFLLAIFFLYAIREYLIYKKIDLKNIFVIFIAGIIAIFMYIPFWNTLIIPLIEPLTTTLLKDGRSGTFLLKDEFGFYNLLILVPSFYGLYLKFSKKNFDIITLGYIAGILWVGLRLFFFTRMFIFFDIFIILLAAYGFAELYKNRKKLFFIVFTGFFILQSAFYYGYIYYRGAPLIRSQEFEFIKKIPTIIPYNSVVMVGSARYSPWTSGYITTEIIAPGLFHLDSWDLEEWNTWWRKDPQGKCDMIEASYTNISSPLYIYIGEIQRWEIGYEIETGPCFDLIESDGIAKLLEIKFN